MVIANGFVSDKNEEEKEQPRLMIVVLKYILDYEVS